MATIILGTRHYNIIMRCWREIRLLLLLGIIKMIRHDWPAGITNQNRSMDDKMISGNNREIGFEEGLL